MVAEAACRPVPQAARTYYIEALTLEDRYYGMITSASEGSLLYVPGI